MAKQQRNQLEVVESLEDLPDFPDERAEADFWGNHTFSNKLLAEMRPPTEEEAPRARRSRPISLRVSEDFLTRIQALAQRENRPYQALLKDYVMERIEQEEQGETARIVPNSSPAEDRSPAPVRGKVSVSAVPAGTPEHRVYVLDVWADAVTVDDTFSFTEVHVHAGGGGYFYTHHRKQMTLEETISYLMEIRDREPTSQT